MLHVGDGGKLLPLFSGRSATWRESRQPRCSGAPAPSTSMFFSDTRGHGIEEDDPLSCASPGWMSGATCRLVLRLRLCPSTRSFVPEGLVGCGCLMTSDIVDMTSAAVGVEMPNVATLPSSQTHSSQDDKARIGRQSSLALQSIYHSLQSTALAGRRL